MPELVEIMDPLLTARQKLREMFTKLHRKLLLIVRDDGVCILLKSLRICSFLARRNSLETSAR